MLRQRLDVAPLTLDVDGIEGHRRFAGTRNAGKADQLVGGKLERYRLEVVNADVLQNNILILAHRVLIIPNQREIGRADWGADAVTSIGASGRITLPGNCLWGQFMRLFEN